MVYDFESTGRRIILSIHNTLYFKGENHNFIPPFMMRLSGLEVHEIPKFLFCNPMMMHHFILLTDLNLQLLLHTKSIIYYMTTRRSDVDKIGKFYQHLLTPDTPEWYLYYPRYSYQ